MFRRGPEGDKLEVLARDSWQLELLVTGFALAGMLGGYGEFMNWSSRTTVVLASDGIVANIAGGAVVCLSVAYLLTLINFFLHVVIRCLWIGALGSRSVMGKTTFVRRRLAPQFQRFLQRRNGDFDAYVQQLDDAASLIFAFTFMLIATVVSFFSVVLLLTAVFNATRSDTAPDWVGYLVAGLVVVYLIGGLVYLIDFLTAGYLKRFRRFSTAYYPVYRFFGWITFARLYRPLYYNLVNRRGGRRLVYLLVPYLLISLVVSGIEAHPNPYMGEEFFDKDYNSAQVLDYHHYQDQLSEGDRHGAVIIPSDLIRTSPLRVVIPLGASHAEYTEHRCPDLPPLYSSVLLSRLFNTGRQGYYDGREFLDSSKLVLTSETVDCLVGAIELSLNGDRFANDRLLLRRVSDDPIAQAMGFLSLDSLPQGIHRLRYRQFKPPGRRHPEDTVRYDITVPFYYAPGD
jgi:hypothetical protein